MGGTQQRLDHGDGIAVAHALDQWSYALDDLIGDEVGGIDGDHRAHVVGVLDGEDADHESTQ